jgi:hypothetical protein
MTITPDLTALVDAAEEIAADLYGDVTEVSLYQLHKLVAQLSGREVRPQMMYNYARKGVRGLKAVDGKVTAQAAIDFAVDYASRNGR